MKPSLGIGILVVPADKLVQEFNHDTERKFAIVTCRTGYWQHRQRVKKQADPSQRAVYRIIEESLDGVVVVGILEDGLQFLAQVHHCFYGGNDVLLLLLPFDLTRPSFFVQRGSLPAN
jgi:hypothetical protein